MEMSGKGLLHSYEQASPLMGHQPNNRTSMFYRIKLTAYACICIVINDKTCSVPLNILNSAD